MKISSRSFLDYLRQEIHREVENNASIADILRVLDSRYNKYVETQEPYTKLELATLDRYEETLPIKAFKVCFGSSNDDYFYAVACPVCGKKVPMDDQHGGYPQMIEHWHRNKVCPGSQDYRIIYGVEWCSYLGKKNEKEC